MRLNKKTSYLIITLFAVLTVFFGYQASKIEVSDDIKTYVPKNDPEKLIYDDVSEKFGLNTLILAGVSFDDVSKHMNLIDKVTEELKNTEGVDNVISVVNAPRINATDDGDISVGNLKSSFNFSNYDVKKMKEILLNDSMLKGKFVSSDGKASLIIIGLKNNADTRLAAKNIRKIFDNNKLNYHLLGTPTADIEIENLVKKNIEKLVPIVTLLVAFVLFLSFRTLTGVILPIMSVLLADIWTVGVMVLFNVMFNTTTAAVPIAIVGIGTAYAIHVINKYYEEAQKGISKADAVNETLKHVGGAVVLSALTTIAGFLSLLTADLRPVWQLGIFTSTGIAISLLSATLLVPAILMIIQPSPKNNSNEEGESKWLRKTTEFLVHNRVLSFSIVGVIIFIMILFIPNIKTDVQMENYLNPNTEFVQSSNFLRDNFGGNDYLFLDFKAKGKNTFRDFYFNRSIRDFENYAKTFDIATQSTSVGDVVAKLTEGFTGVEYIPGSNDALEQNYMLIEGSEGIDKVLKADENESISQIMVNTKSFSKVKESELKIKDFINSQIIKSYKIEDFDTNNDEHLKAYNHEIRQFIESRRGTYNEKVLNDFVNIKNMSDEELLKSTDNKTLFNMFNTYLKINELDEIDYQTFENVYNKKSSNEDLNEYFEYFVMDNVDQMRAKLAIKKLEKDNLKLNSKYLIELAQYVNDTQVPVIGGDRKIVFNITGIPVIANKVNDMIFDNQMKSMILAYILVFVLFILQMKSVTLGLFSLIPITLTIIANFGFMGITGIALNAATVTIASITIGAGIDYTIHYITRFKKEYKLSSNKFESAVKTSATAGRAIIINSLAVVLGFMAFGFSSIGILKDFGILTAVAMIIAPILTLTIFPMAMTMLSDKVLGKLTKKSILNKKAKENA
ncbi:antibiotic transporter [Tepiditoga spiralis]|uniref:Antibiotic transporter n=1 Tax=Tepiditoga spiralis TaxID=2108365 RepID=A0A7G1G3Z5_9BACT|nr:MMPL family transporter [Tepiditoga spiralis]BBE31178.1 antibiotic transporter [Tepiditoga spiralis]